MLPGNKLEISLETASTYIREQKGNKYGFKCLIIGYDNKNLMKYPSTSLIHLEYELSYLGGLCSANLLKKDLVFSGKLTAVDGFYSHLFTVILMNR